jgi:hypothetical protein
MFPTGSFLVGGENRQVPFRSVLLSPHEFKTFEQIAKECKLPPTFEQAFKYAPVMASADALREGYEARDSRNELVAFYGDASRLKKHFQLVKHIFWCIYRVKRGKDAPFPFDFVQRYAWFGAGHERAAYVCNTFISEFMNNDISSALPAFVMCSRFMERRMNHANVTWTKTGEPFVPDKKIKVTKLWDAVPLLEATYAQIEAFAYHLEVCYTLHEKAEDCLEFSPTDSHVRFAEWTKNEQVCDFIMQDFGCDRANPQAFAQALVHRLACVIFKVADKNRRFYIVTWDQATRKRIRRQDSCEEAPSNL